MIIEYLVSKGVWILVTWILLIVAIILMFMDRLKVKHYFLFLGIFVFLKIMVEEFL